jgi:hypothetical protein
MLRAPRQCLAVEISARAGEALALAEYAHIPVEPIRQLCDPLIHSFQDGPAARHRGVFSYSVSLNACQHSRAHRGVNPEFPSFRVSARAVTPHLRRREDSRCGLSANERSLGDPAACALGSFRDVENQPQWTIPRRPTVRA